jgi:hypothetical protein
MRTIHLETELPTSADAVWQAMQHPTSFLYVTRGLFGIPALAGRTAPFHEGERGAAWLLAFHLIPAWRHTIHLVDLDDTTRTMRSQERGGALRSWRHTLHVEPAGEHRCVYSDTIEIDAGPLTGLVARVSVRIFRYRQRRWHKLVRNQLLPSGPRYTAA